MSNEPSSPNKSKALLLWRIPDHSEILQGSCSIIRVISFYGLCAADAGLSRRACACYSLLTISLSMTRKTHCSQHMRTLGTMMRVQTLVIRMKLMADWGDVGCQPACNRCRSQGQPFWSRYVAHRAYLCIPCTAPLEAITMTLM